MGSVDEFQDFGWMEDTEILSLKPIHVRHIWLRAYNGYNNGAFFPDSHNAFCNWEYM